VEGEEVGKGYGRVNMVQICVHMYVHGKMRPAETIPGMGKWGMKEYDGGGEFNCDVFGIL
jgi:hypothetical protein